MVASAWEITKKFHLSWREPLQSLWAKFGASRCAGAPCSDGKGQGGSKQKAKENCKWPEIHKAFMKKEDLQSTLSLPQVQWAHEAFKSLSSLPEREVEAMHLAFAKLRKLVGEDTSAERLVSSLFAVKATLCFQY